MAEPVETSSVDRFIWDRGSGLLGYGYAHDQNGPLGLYIGGVIQTVLGIAFGVIGLLGTAPRATTFGVIGALEFVVGVDMIVGGLLLQRKLGREIRTEARLTAEGRKLLTRVFQHVGWTQHQNLHMGWNWGGWGRWGKRTSAQVLTPESFALLEAGAFEFNRLSGLLKIDGSRIHPTIDRLRASIRAAADEAMIGIWNQVAILEKMPESRSSITRQIESDIGALREMGERVEGLQKSERTLTDRLSGTSAIDSVLDQLRLDESARAELASDEDDSPELWNRTR